MKTIIVATNLDRSKFILTAESSLDIATDIDNGIISPCMKLPKGLNGEDCIILVCPTHPSFIN